MGFGQYLFISAVDGNSPRHTDRTMRAAESRAVSSHVEKSPKLQSLCSEMASADCKVH